MTVREVAVLGGGNGALTTAGDMALAGFKVRMWTAFPEELGEIYKTKTIKMRGLGRQGAAKIQMVTRDIGEALSGADVICSFSPAFSQALSAQFETLIHTGVLRRLAGLG
jgi:opine dehydrogenase